MLRRPRLRTAFDSVPLLLVLTAMLASPLIFVLLPRRDDAGSTSVEINQPLSELALDRAAPPDIYTGEIVDIDQDGTPDVALFGARETPTIRPLSTSEPTNWWVLLAPTLILFVAAIVGPVVAQFAKHRWPTPTDNDDD